ncbi:carboxypeptidase regulatory-like domain-containing protein [Labilibaculum sp.]|uniref:carboxypeptidase regulatory-like domain-containing protein n=1 Tax=Labilibaculum sp. TaxID=2060723 RepID=UPI003562F62F
MRSFYLQNRFFIAFFLALLLISCNESTIDPDLYGSISGTVNASDDEGGLPMKGVSLTTSPGTTSVTTDSDGYFYFDEVEVGDYTVSAKKEDYSTVTTSITVREGKEVVMELVMEVDDADSESPDEPIYSSPADASTDQEINVELVWNDGETDTGDTLFYDVIIYEEGSVTGDTIAEAITDTTFIASDLNFETTYRWKVNVSNRARYETEGREWRFSTEDFPQNGYLFVKDTLESLDIYSWDLADNHLVRLTSGGANEVSPRISPNEQWIAYTSNKSGDYHLYTMDTKGGNVVKVTNDKPLASYHTDGSGFVWSPEGDQLLYGHYGSLYKIDSDGSGEKKIASAPVNRQFKSCDWSDHYNNASQEKIAVLTQGEKPYDNEIYLMDSDGSNLFLLVDNLAGTISSPHFSPNGSKVIFSLDTLFQDDDGRQLNAKIYSIDVDGTNLTDLSGDDKTDGTNDLQARFTETGGKIVFMNVDNDDEGTKSIWVMDTDGENREQIISNGEMPDVYNP